MPAPRDAQVTRRFVELLEWYRRADRGRGWQGRLAERLGLHRPDLSNILGGRRNVTAELATQVAQRIGLDPAYFWNVGPPDHFFIPDPGAIGPDDPGLIEPDRSLRQLLQEALDVRRDLAERPNLAARNGRILALEILRSRLVTAAADAARAASLSERVDAAHRLAELFFSEADELHDEIERLTKR